MTNEFLKREIKALVGNMGKLNGHCVDFKITDSDTFGSDLSLCLDGLTDKQTAEALCGLSLLLKSSPSDQVAHRANIHMYEYDPSDFCQEEWPEDITLESFEYNHYETGADCYHSIKNETSVEFVSCKNSDGNLGGLAEYLIDLTWHFGNNLFFHNADEATAFLFKNNA